MDEYEIRKSALMMAQLDWHSNMITRGEVMDMAQAYAAFMAMGTTKPTPKFPPRPPIRE